LTSSCILFSVGIANTEEFSLLVEGQKEDKEDADKMGTIKRVCCLKTLLCYVYMYIHVSCMCSFDCSFTFLKIHVQLQMNPIRNIHS